MRKEQFEEFLSAHEKRIYHYLLSLLGNDSDANDVVQMVFISFYEHIDRVEDLGNFLELEVVLEEGEPEADGVREAEELLAALAIPQSALVDRAYVDLLEAGGKGEPSRP